MVDRLYSLESPTPEALVQTTILGELNEKLTAKDADHSHSIRKSPQ